MTESAERRGRASEKKLRILQRKLDNSERHRARSEEILEVKTRLFKSKVAELEATQARLLEAHRQLEQSQDDLRVKEACIASSLNGIAIANLEGELIYVNRAFAELWRCDDPAILLKSRVVSLWVDPDEAAEVREALMRNGRWRGERTALRRDGSTLEVQFDANVVRDSDGGIRYMMASVLDISEAKRAAQDLDRARAIAEAANRAKSDFLANLSHELRTPLHAVIGLNHLVLRTEINADQRDYLAKIGSASQTLLRLIESTLDFSKIDAGKLELEEVPFRFDDVLGSLADLMVVTADQKGLELVFECAPEVPETFIGDPLRLGQVLSNLVGNAVKFTESGRVTLAVGVGEARADRHLLRFTVQDTGIGLSAEQISGLFRAFAQADASHTRKYGGTGLGLAICKQLVHAMGGQIQVRSTPGEGSTFAFEVVLGKVGGPTPPALATPEHARVLLIHRGPGRTFLERVLTARGYVLLSQESILEAARRLRSGQVDALVVELEAALQEGAPFTDELLSAAHEAGVRTVVLGMPRAHALIGKKPGLRLLPGPLIRSRLLERLETTFEPAGADPLKAAAAAPSLIGGRVLLAEDDVINQQVAREILEGFGLDVCVASDGAEAVRLARDREFDLVLMDLQMPMVDGYQATLELRSDPRLATLPIVAMTANAMVGERERCLAMGMNEYLTKPVEPEHLLEILARWFWAPPVVQRGTSDIDTGPDGWRHLPGLEVERGLHSLGGNEALYRQLLGDFPHLHGGVVEVLREASRTDDSERLRHRLHTLKGVAGNLGLVDVQAAAGALERLARRSALDGEAFLGIEGAMRTALQSIEDWLGEGPESGAPAPVAETTEAGKREEIESAIDELGALLDAGSTEATRTMASLVQLYGAQAPAAVSTLAAQVRGLNFEAARSTLETISREMGS